MSRIELTPDELFEDPNNLALLSSLTCSQVEQLIGCSMIYLLHKECNGKDIEFNKPDEIKQTLNRIWKSIEKDILLSYNDCGK